VFKGDWIDWRIMYWVYGLTSLQTDVEIDVLSGSEASSPRCALPQLLSRIYTSCNIIGCNGRTMSAYYRTRDSLCDLRHLQWVELALGNFRHCVEAPCPS
jgi:hypothetical protein